jgi:hypothetical protein
MLLAAALLMVSRFPYAHLINRFVRGRKRFRTLVGFFLLAMAIAWQPHITILLGIYLYAMSAPVMAVYTWATGRVRAPAPMPGTQGSK